MTIALVFDYDDTLAQTRECKFAALQALAGKSYGIALDAADIEKHWGKPYRQFFSDLFNVGGSRLDELLLEYELLNAEFPMRLHADAKRLISNFLPMAFCGIVSSASGTRILSQLQMLGVPGDRFNFIHGAEHTVVHKPDPKVFDPAIEVIRNYCPEHVEIIYIGDAYADYCAAAGAGLRFIGIPRNAQARAQLKAAGAEVVESLDDLPAAVNPGRDRRHSDTGPFHGSDT